MELLIVLHAHLPWVSDPGEDTSLEGRWLLEALWECYLPLLGVLDRAADHGQRSVLTLSLSPTLLAMLGAPRLPGAFRRHVRALLDVAARAIRHAGPGLRADALRGHVERIEASLARFEAAGGDVAGAFGDHHRAGTIELTTTAATHPLLPNLRSLGHRSAQLAAGPAYLEARTGVSATGLWLPECAYAEGLDEALVEAGVGWTLLDGHGVALGRPRSPLGVHAPVLSPAGLAVFGRDEGAATRVWSRRHGYPGDPAYREFHRDLALELPSEALGRLASPPGACAPIGLRPYRVTGAEAKELYDPAAARLRVASHAAHFLSEAARTLAHAPRANGVPAVLCAPYDAELFGHWWWEGPQFLEAVLSEAARSGAIRPTTPTDRLVRHPKMVVSAPATSTWGEGGFGAVWTGEDTAPMLRAVHAAERQVEGAFRALSTGAQPREEEHALRLEARDLAARELMLAAASDWAFLVRTGTNVDYARRRAEGHLEAVRVLSHLARRGGDALTRLALDAIARRGPSADFAPRALLERAYAVDGMA